MIDADRAGANSSGYAPSAQLKKQSSGDGLAIGVKLAVTDFGALITMVQVPVPVQSPPHPVNEFPTEGVAVRVTLTPLKNDAPQVCVQLMPPGLLTTFPTPEPEMLTLRADASGAGDTDADGVDAAPVPAALAAVTMKE